MKHRTCDSYSVTPLSEAETAYPSGAHESTPFLQLCSYCSISNFLCSGLYAPFLLASVLSVLRITTSGYPFGIFLVIFSHNNITCICTFRNPSWVVFCRSLFVLISYFLWPLYCLSFFHLRSLITPSKHFYGINS